MSLSVEWRGVEALRRKLRPELVREPAARLIERAADFTTREVRAGAQEVSANVARSFSAQVRPLSARVVSRHPGALPLEFGRRAGTKQPPLEALRSWAAARGLEEVLFPIARAIARRGIRGRFFARRTVQRLMAQELPRLLGRAVLEIRARWGESR